MSDSFPFVAVFSSVGFSTFDLRSDTEPNRWSKDGGGLAWKRGAFWGKGKQLREMKAEEELKVIECWRILLVAEALFTAIYFFDSLPLGCGP